MNISASTLAHHQEEDTSFGAWTLVWVHSITKVITVVLAIWAANSHETAVLVTVTTWLWLDPLLAMGAAPAIFRCRLRKARVHRAAPVEREWSLSESDDLALRPVPFVSE